MYLLNRVDNETVVPVTEFTFHYVSIKSGADGKYNTARINLHSTMYLLNRSALIPPLNLFENLQSTMYLLNPGLGGDLELNKDIYIPLCIY